MSASRSGAARRLVAAASCGPLGERNFRLLFCARCVSLLGDGAFLVALAWQTYTLSNAPTALSLLGIAMTVPLIALLLVGGVVSDRHEKRRVMLAADLVRAVLLAVLAALAISGRLRLWHMMVLVAVYGGAQAFFDPASDAILPELLPEAQLGRANALEQIVRPLALRLAGPALGGLLIASAGVGTTFLLDAVTFVAPAVALSLISLARAGRQRVESRMRPAVLKRQLREGFAYVRMHPWLWATLASAAVAYLLFMGPTLVLLPLMVKHVLAGSSVQLGLVLGAGGVGAMACAALMLRGARSSEGIAFIYVVWAFATLAVAAYGLASAIWQLMLACLVFNFLETGGTIAWATMKQVRVPGELLGRVASLDWLISVGLLPVSLALTAPVSAVVGVRGTLVGAGVTGGLVTLAALMIPGVRRADRATQLGRVPVSDAAVV